MRKFLLAFLAAASISTAGHTAPVVDQVNIAPPALQNGDPLSISIINDLPTVNFDLAGLQFVTAGMSGQLSRVDLQLAKAFGPTGAPLNFGTGRLIIGKDIVFGADGDIEGGVKLAEISFSPTAIGDFNNLTQFDTSAFNIFLNAGDQFAIAVLPDQALPVAFRWAFSADVYSGGAGFLGVQPTGNTDDDFTWIESGAQVPAKDFGFRTWMNPVPEPASWALMIVGFGMVGGMMRNRRLAITTA